MTDEDIVVLRKVVEALVPSESIKGAFYLVTINDKDATCTCPTFKYRKDQTLVCKHIDRAREETTQ